MEDLKIFSKDKETKYRTVLNAIREYNKIAIFRHVHPDFDALGSAWGLKEFINTNFMNKDIKVLGDNHDELTPRLYPKSNIVENNWFNEPFLAIVLDTPNKSRVSDPRYVKAELIIKIDHHPFVENIGDIEIIEPKASSNAELLVNMMCFYQMKFSKEAARYLYSGIAGDSGRFEYGSTSPHTFICAKLMLEVGIDINEIYSNMYLHHQNDLKVIAHILSHFTVTSKGVAYYVLSRKDLAHFHITTSQGKDHINLFRHVDGIKIWCAIAEDQKESCYHVSMRSKNIDISKVAFNWRGGGHIYACGAKLNNLAELKDFILDLDELI